MGSAKKLCNYAEMFNIVGAIFFTAFLAISVYVHPGFNVFSPNQSVSDLGRIGDSKGYIFNAGVIISSIFFFIGFTGYFIHSAEDTFRRLSAAVFFVSLIMFLCIGVFPKGTQYHNFFAISFFLISTIAMFLWCKSEIFHGNKILGILILSLTIASYGIYFNYHILGFAFAELFGGYVIILWMLLFKK